VSRVRIEDEGPVLHIVLDRPAKANAFDGEMIAELAGAYTELDRDPARRVGLVTAEGRTFTGGLDLPAVAPLLADGRGDDLLPAGLCDPWGMYGPLVSKPVVVGVHGRCFTAGLELVLAADCCIAADDAVFGQQEVTRGIVAFGGATQRLPERAGWGGALRYLLTGDTFDAAEALRLGIVQQVVPAPDLVATARGLAERIAAQAPLAVQATLRNARLARSAPTEEVAAALRSEIRALATSADAAEAVTAMVERRDPVFRGA
jgi:enoyl-CoA hydratase